MGTVGIAVLSALGGMFCLGLLAGLVVLIYVALGLRKALATAATQNQAVYAETRTLIAGYQAEMKAVTEAAKSSFQSLRQEMKAILEEHRKQMQTGIDKINAEALTGAAARSIQACIRIEKAASVIATLFTEGQSRVTDEYPPEAFAPEEPTPSGKFYGPPSGFSVGMTSILDAEAEREQVETQQQSETFAGVEQS